MSKLGLRLGVLVTSVAPLVGCATQQAQQQQQQGFDWTIIAFMAVIFAVFYFLMIRPQRRRQKQHQEMMQQLKRGNRVVTASGIYGEIDALDEDSVLLKVESGAIIRMARNSVVGIRQR